MLLNTKMVIQCVIVFLMDGVIIKTIILPIVAGRSLELIFYRFLLEHPVTLVAAGILTHQCAEQRPCAGGGGD